MKLSLKSDAGLVREVPTGLSWTGFIFTGFTMMTRGMIAKGLVYLLIIYSVQTMTVVAQLVVTAADGEKAGAAAGGVYLILLSIPNFIFLFKINKWTARHWLDRGYKPQGPGWVQWGPKFGIQVSEELAAASVGIKNIPTVRAKDVLGFIFAAFCLIIIMAASFSGGDQRDGERPAVSQSPAPEKKAQSRSATATRPATSKNIPETPSTGSTRDERRVSPKPEHITIKGLAIGMDIDAARQVLIQALGRYNIPLEFGGGSPEYAPVQEFDENFVFLIRPQGIPLMILTEVDAGLDKKVTFIGFSDSVVNELFGAKEMKASEFAQAFVNAYSISKLIAMDDGEGWYCVTDDGTRIEITTNKHLSIKKVKSKREQAAQFN